LSSSSLMSSSSSVSSGISASLRRSSMTPSAGVAAWPKSDKPRARRWLKVAVACLAGLLLADTLAGALFLWSIHGNVRQATPLTLTRYGYYYGGRAEVRPRPWETCALGLAAAGVSAGAGLPPPRRPPPGHAPPSRRAAIAAAGA